MRGGKITAARSTAYIILFVFLVASGISLSVLLLGNRDLALQICVGSVIVNGVILIAGALGVGANRS
jgi:hypothetical protein